MKQSWNNCEGAIGKFETLKTFDRSDLVSNGTLRGGPQDPGQLQDSWFLVL